MRRAGYILLALASLYLGSYIALSACGTYAPMGTKWVWRPYGFAYTIVLETGFSFAVHLNPLARFYVPLLMLDLRWWHADRPMLGGG